MKIAEYNVEFAQFQFADDNSATSPSEHEMHIYNSISYDVLLVYSLEEK